MNLNWPKLHWFNHEPIDEAIAFAIYRLDRALLSFPLSRLLLWVRELQLQRSLQCFGEDSPKTEIAFKRWREANHLSTFGRRLASSELAWLSNNENAPAKKRHLAWLAIATKSMQFDNSGRPQHYFPRLSRAIYRLLQGVVPLGAAIVAANWILIAGDNWAATIQQFLIMMVPLVVFARLFDLLLFYGHWAAAEICCGFDYL